MVALLKEETFSRYTAAEARIEEVKSRSQSRPQLRLVETPTADEDRSFRLDLEFPIPDPAPTPTPVRREVARARVAPAARTAVGAPPVVTPQLAIFTALLILALMSAVRLSQGAPPANSWDSLAPAPAVLDAPGAGETVLVVDVGDTLWDLAGEIAPGVDRRQVVVRLAERNGGSALQAGQRLIIPSEFSLTEVTEFAASES